MNHTRAHAAYAAAHAAFKDEAKPLKIKPTAISAKRGTRAPSLSHQSNRRNFTELGLTNVRR